jgi:5-methylcytosine-specific restriction endonuclease McrA
MIRGRHRIPLGHAHVGLTKHRLFVRDRHVCAYCGTYFVEGELTVEHIQPVSRGGRHDWTNVVTACRSCNTRKGNRRPEEANMPLLYVPYAVSRSEGFILSNRRILADQMAFLQATLPRHSRWAYA